MMRQKHIPRAPAPVRLAAQLPLVAALVAGGALLAGCDKREPAPSQPATSTPSPAPAPALTPAPPPPGDTMGGGGAAPSASSPASTP